MEDAYCCSRLLEDAYCCSRLLYMAGGHLRPLMKVMPITPFSRGDANHALCWGVSCSRPFLGVMLFTPFIGVIAIYAPFQVAFNPKYNLSYMGRF